MFEQQQAIINKACSELFDVARQIAVKLINTAIDNNTFAGLRT